jgi:type I restriction enzyme, S subunit
MSVTWRESTIQQLTKYVGRGKSPVYADRGGVPSINQACIQNGGIDLSRTKNVTSTHFASLSSEKIAHEGDVLLNSTGTGTLGRVGYWDSPVDISFDSHVTLLRFTERNVGKFFYYWLGTHEAQRLIENYCVTGSTNQIELARQPLLQLRVRHPEQHDAQLKIVECIDSVESEIRTLEAVIAKQERVRAGLLQALLTRGIDENGEIRSGPTKNELSQASLVPRCWSYITLGSLLKKTGGHIQTGPFGTQLKASEYSNTGLPLFNPQDISPRGLLIYDHAARVSIERAAPLMRHRVRPGDVLFGRRGDLSRAAVVREDDDGLCGSDCLLMRYSNEKMLPDWFWLIFKSPICQRPLARSAVGTTMVGLNTALIEELNFWMPTVAEQHRIVEAVQMQDRVIELQLQRLEKLKMLKTGLMRDLLSGRMSVEPLLPDLPPKP